MSLQATFAGDFTFYEEAGVGATAQANLTTARVMATPTTAGLLAPAPAMLALSGSTALNPRESKSIPVGQSATPVIWSDSTDVMSRYTGSGTVKYDIDFTAFYPQLVTVTPGTVTCILCNDVVTGEITVTYSASNTPTGVALQSLGASWAGPGLVVVDWRAGVESNLIGFYLEREVSADNWLRVSVMIPAMGDSAPHSYRFEEANVDATSEVRYRLLSVSADGQTTVLGETVVQVGVRASLQVTATGFELGVQGLPNQRVFVEEATDVVNGPWVPQGSILLDAQGTGAMTIAVSADPARFYRLLRE